jgi:uncharacterized protein YciI
MIDRRFLFLAGVAAGASNLLLKENAMASEPPPTYFVLFHSPGPRWREGKAFQLQPGIMSHVEYMSGFFARGKLLMGGPFLDGSGGMMVFRTATIEEAREIADADPAVKGGLLTVTVKPWLAAFHH